MKNLSNTLNEKTISLILGGGAGTRLYPLTKDRSKPAVPIGGKYRLIDIPISNCLNSGLTRIHVLTQFNSASLNRHIKNTFHFDNFSLSYVDILAAEQTRKSIEWFQGTADAVRKTMPHMRHTDYEMMLILSGDQLYQMDFSEMLEYHLEKGADITIATIPVVAEDATGFGIMRVDAEGNIGSFIEKPHLKELENWRSHVSTEMYEQGKHYLASMGIYIFNRKLLEKLLNEDYQKATDFGKEIIPHAMKDGCKVFSYAYDGYWTDIGDIRSFFEANLKMAQYRPPFNIFDRQYSIYTRPRLLPPTKIYGTILNNTLIAEGSLIHAKEIDNSVIGIRSVIDEGTVIKNTYIMGNDYYEYTEDEKSKIRMGIGKNCIIENAIVDKDVRIGDNVTIRGRDDLLDIETEEYVIRNGVIVLKKSVNIAPNTHIGK